ncbi:MAG TPA: dolichyl-phosphate beta-glucosyltransferase [Candidatus Bipolaricaulota bacterium]|nr:dolichyl-phosphate beta-glucosyltransferase [Candidatus Bipolaricaulota bacterium]
MPQLSVIIPVYNEEKRIGQTLPVFLNYLNNSGLDFEIIAVNDGSSDRSTEILKTFPSIKIIELEKNSGKGAAVRAGMLAADGDFLLFADADNSTPIEELKKLWTYKDNFDIIIGSRHVRGSDVKIKQPLTRRAVSFAGNLLIRLLACSKIKDTQCGFKLFSKNSAKKLFRLQKINRWGFDIELLYLARKMKFPVKETPVVWIDSPRNSIKTKDIFLTFIELIKIRFSKYDL